MKKLILMVVMVVVFLGFCWGCSHFGTVKRYINDPKFQQENQPVREMRLAMITEGIPSEEFEKEIKELVREASGYLEKERVGMTLKISHWIPVVWKMAFRFEDEPELLDRLIGLTKNNKLAGITWDSFDFGVFFSKNYFGPEAAYDTRVRRFIVLRRYNAHALVREIPGLFGHDHEKRVPLYFPFLIWGVPINRRYHFTLGERETILKNKWRDFTKLLPSKLDKTAEQERKIRLEEKDVSRSIKRAVTERGLHVIPFFGEKNIWIDSREDITKVFVYLDGTETLLGKGKILTLKDKELLLDGQKIWPRN